MTSATMHSVRLFIEQSPETRIESLSPRTAKVRQGPFWCAILLGRTLTSCRDQDLDPVRSLMIGPSIRVVTVPCDFSHPSRVSAKNTPRNLLKLVLVFG